MLYRADDLRLLLVLGPPSARCEIVLNDRLTSALLTTGQQEVVVHAIEAVDLTGDSQFELYIWLDKKGGGRFVAAAVHVIYALVNGTWQKALHVEQCLRFSSFEFRDSSILGAKDVYQDSDPVCDVIAGYRKYNLLRWDGSSFATVERGELRYSTLQNLMLWAICASPLFLAWTLGYLRNQRRQR